MPYFTFAERFGWTPDQVDRSPAWLVDRFAVILDAVAEARETVNRQNAAAARAAEHARRR